MRNWNSGAAYFSGTTGDSGLSSHSFEYKGVVYVPQQDPDQDQATDLAIEAGAEEVQEEVDDEGNKVLQVCTVY